MKKKYCILPIMYYLIGHHFTFNMKHTLVRTKDTSASTLGHISGLALWPEHSTDMKIISLGDCILVTVRLRLRQCTIAVGLQPTCLREFMLLTQQLLWC